GGRSGAEDVQFAGAEQVDDTGHQRRFRADDGQLHVLFREVRQLLDGQHVDGNVLALGFGGGARVAGRDEDLLDARILRDFPGQGVLATAAADDQYVHRVVSLSLGADLDKVSVMRWMDTVRS